MKKAKALFFVFVPLLFANCSTSSDLVLPSNRNIQSITISYNGNLNNFSINEYFEIEMEAYQDPENYQYPQNFDAGMEEVNLVLSQEYWEPLVSALKRLRKIGAFTPVRNPVGCVYSIRIVYQNNKETVVSINYVNFHTINGAKYKPDGAEFGIFNEIIANKEN